MSKVLVIIGIISLILTRCDYAQSRIYFPESPPQFFQGSDYE